MSKPFFKQVGGKTQNLPDLLREIPENFGAYYEPMVGGGALFWALARLGRLEGKKVVLADSNPHIVKAFIQVRDNVQSLVDRLKFLDKVYRRDDSSALYYRVRDAWNNGDHGADHFIFLKQTAFNGMWRLNRKGEVNMPWGQYEDPKILDEENLLSCSKMLQGVDLRVGPWSQTLVDVEVGDLVYFDPPYLGCFDKYTADGFTYENHKNLVLQCSILTNMGVHVMYSNEGSDAVRNILDQVWQMSTILPVKSRRFVNRDGKGREPVNDFLVVSSTEPRTFTRMQQGELFDAREN